MRCYLVFAELVFIQALFGAVSHAEEERYPCVAACRLTEYTLRYWITELGATFILLWRLLRHVGRERDLAFWTDDYLLGFGFFTVTIKA